MINSNPLLLEENIAMLIGMMEFPNVDFGRESWLVAQSLIVEMLSLMTLGLIVYIAIPY